MIDLIGEDLFDQIETSDAICITTNCSYLDDGTNPMGGGCAGEAARRWPEIESIYGDLLSLAPNVPVVIAWFNKITLPEELEFRSALIGPFQGISKGNFTALIAFPTMFEIGEPASIELIERSAMLLEELANLHSWERVIIPRPGSGIGGLNYEKQVKPILKDILDDRFVIIHK